MYVYDKFFNLIDLRSKRVKYQVDIFCNLTKKNVLT